jgi:hypothetical protein
MHVIHHERLGDENVGFEDITRHIHTKDQDELMRNNDSSVK